VTALDDLLRIRRAHDKAWNRILTKRRIDSDAKLMALLRRLDWAGIVPVESWAGQPG
jgi:hypothetical protein